MHVVQILLPLYDNDGRAFPRGMFDEIRTLLTDRFGGVTAHVRAPATGLWKEHDGDIARDDVVIYEVMVDALDSSWWSAFREEHRRRFRQEELVVRAIPAVRL